MVRLLPIALILVVGIAGLFSYAHAIITNIPPSFDPIADQSVSENSSSQNIFITNVSGPESDQTVTMSAASSDPSIIPNPEIAGSGSTRTLTYTPVTNAAGSVIIIVTADDGQLSDNIYSGTFSIAVNASGGSITIDSANLNLDADNESNGIIDIGDSISINVTLDNSDGGCVEAGTVVIADLQKYGGGDSVVLSCVDNGGVGDFFATNLIVADAGGDSGIDVGADDEESRVTLTYSDSDDAPTSVDTNTMFEPVDTIAPWLSSDVVWIDDATGTDDAFKSGDIPVFTFDPSEESDTIVSVVMDAENFRTGDNALGALFDEDNAVYTATLSGNMDAQDDTDNTVTVTITDDAGNTASAASNPYTVDTILPGFEVENPVVALTQNGDETASPTNVWYYYNEDSFRMRVIAAAESDGNPLVEVKVCDAGIVFDGGPDYECNSDNFDDENYYAAFSLVDLPENDVIWELNEPIGFFPNPGGYVMNVELTDDAGNTIVSASPAQMFVAAIGIDPKLFEGALNNDTTTDWSAIDDFTDISELIFSARDYDEDLEEYTDVEIGRLTVGNAENHINLTDQDTITGLSNFGSNLTINGEEMRINSSALETLNLPAELRMRVETADRPGLIVKDNNGTVRGYVSDDATGDVPISWEEEICEEEGEEEICETVEYSHTLGGFSWDNEAQTLIFTTTGFSEFETDNDPPTVSVLGDESEDYIIFSEGGVFGLNFNESLSSAGKTAVENAISAAADHEPGGYSWQDIDSVLAITPNTEFNITFANDVIADVADGVGNVANNLLLIDSALDEDQQEGGADVETDTDGDEIVILDDDVANGITIPEGVDDVTINVDNLVTDGEGILPEITISAVTSVGDVTVAIPSGVTVSGGEAWSGIINAPTVEANNSVSGVDGTVDSVIEVGFGSTKLTFNKGVRILIEGKAGKRVGYSQGGPFTEITSTCAGDSQATGDALAAGADCKIDVGSDLVLWTKHFTSFVTFTPAAVVAPTAPVSQGNGPIIIESSSRPSSPAPVFVPAPLPSVQTVAAQVVQALPPQILAAISPSAALVESPRVETEESLSQPRVVEVPEETSATTGGGAASVAAVLPAVSSAEEQQSSASLFAAVGNWGGGTIALALLAAFAVIGAGFYLFVFRRGV